MRIYTIEEQAKMIKRYGLKLKMTWEILSYTGSYKGREIQVICNTNLINNNGWSLWIGNALQSSPPDGFYDGWPHAIDQVEKLIRN